MHTAGRPGDWTGSPLGWDALCPHSPPSHSWWLCPGVPRVSASWVHWPKSGSVGLHPSVTWVLLLSGSLWVGLLLVPRVFLAAYVSLCVCLSRSPGLCVSSFYSSWLMCLDPLFPSVSLDFGSPLFSVFPPSSFLSRCSVSFKNRFWPGFRLPQNYHTHSVCFLLAGP